MVPHATPSPKQHTWMRVASRHRTWDGGLPTLTLQRDRVISDKSIYSMQLLGITPTGRLWSLGNSSNPIDLLRRRVAAWSEQHYPHMRAGKPVPLAPAQGPG
jgi:hypothetical protein